MTSSVLQDFFNQLHGDWIFVREILGSTPATAHGTARFTRQNDNEYDFREDGTLKLQNGEKLQFFRNYIYRLTDRSMDVLYGDGAQIGEHYQSYILAQQQDKLVPIETHICSKDCYRGTYFLIGDNTFTLETAVKGPKKDYTIRTIFSRAPQA